MLKASRSVILNVLVIVFTSVATKKHLQLGLQRCMPILIFVTNVIYYKFDFQQMYNNYNTMCCEHNLVYKQVIETCVTVTLIIKMWQLLMP